MAYTAEINIAIKGAAQLNAVIKKVGEAETAINRINNAWQNAVSGPRGLNAFNQQLSKAKELLNQAQIGTEAETKAVQAYVAALNAANAARDRQNRLIQQQILAQQKIKPGDAGFGVQGPATPSTMRDQRRNGVAGSLRSGTFRGIAENAIIGGSFPLLFGQGGGAAAGGAIGGALGGAFGGAGGFAGSLLGTLIGDIASQGAKIKELGADIGFSAEQTKQLQAAFKLAGVDAEKFTDAVQSIRGVGLDIQDQASIIQTVTRLTVAYGGSIDKTTKAFATALETGKVTQSVLNQLTNQGIHIQEKLADTYKVSRSELLQMAKNGDISVQTLANSLVDLANESSSLSNKTSTNYTDAFSLITDAAKQTASEVQQAFYTQTSETIKNTDSAALQIAASFVRILNSIEPVITATATATGYLVDLGVQTINALSGVPAVIDAITTSIVGGMVPGLGEVFKLLGSVGKNKNAQTGIATGKYAPPWMQVPIPSKIPYITTPAQLEPAGSKSKKDKSAEAAAREAKRVADAIRTAQAETQFLQLQAVLEDKIFKAEQAKDTILAAQLKGKQAILELQFKYAQELAKESNFQVQIAKSQTGIQESKNAQQKQEQAIQDIQNKRLEKFSDVLSDLDLELNLRTAVTEQAREQLRIEYEMRKLKNQNVFTPEQLTQIRQKKEALIQSPAQKRMQDLQTSIVQFSNIENIGVMAADNIGAAFGQAFQDIATGSASAQEALGNMMKSIGENFINMAAQIIAQQTTMIILGGIMKALGLTMGGSGGGTSIGGFAVPDLGKYSFGGFTAPGFADGGFVTGPTRAIVGEGGQPEYIIPASKMQAAMSRYASGARGSSVIPDAGSTGTFTDMSSPEGGGMSTGSIDVRYSVERINSVDYVTADQFQRGIVQAAQQGAAQGEQRTLRRLQQSRSTRSRLGMA